MIKNSPQPDALLSWMDGLADPTRLRLLRLLERQELGVTELCDVLQMPQSTVSRHLKVLAEQGWVHHRRQGTTNRYRMVLDELSSPARQLWLLARQQTDNWATLQQDALRLQQVIALRKADTETFFAGKAGEWDRLREQLYGKSFITRSMLGLLPASWTVADLGCGTGTTAEALAEQVAEVIGVDQSEPMLAAARARMAESSNVDLRQGELENLPVDDACCDGAIISLVLTYLPDPLRVLQEAARILKPGGQLVVVDLMRHDREDFRRQMGQQSMGFEEGELKGLLQSAGLTRATASPLPPEADVTGPALLQGRAIKS